MCIRDSFSSKLEYIKSNDGKIKSIIVNADEIPCEALVLALGHSSRDTYEMLNSIGTVSYTHLDVYKRQLQ